MNPSKSYLWLFYLNHTKFSNGQSKVLSKCDVHPIVYPRKVKGSQMKDHVLWDSSMSDVHDYAYI
jgi:hypothetical protein